MPMFFEILRFELRQQLKAPLFWIVAAVFGALAFALASTDAVIVGGASGNVLRNAPLVVTRLLGVLTMLSIFLVTVFVAGAALRDFDNGTAELFFTTPTGRGAYLGGRFAAGYLAALAVMLACAAGVAIGGMMPWIDAARLGPASWRGYAWAFGVMVVPDMLFIAALLFLLATTTRSLLATYIGLIVYFVLNSVVGLLTRDVNNHLVAAMLDPFGGRTLALVTRYWSADQANLDLPALTGVLLFNRVLWSAVGVAMLGAAVALFRPNREGLQLPRRRKRTEPPRLRPQASVAALTLPKVRLADDLRAHLLQLRTQFVFDTVGVLRGPPFLIMLALGLFNLIFALALSSQIYGTATWPVTHQVLDNIRGSFQWLLYIIITFYAGELVWRERSQRSAEVSDAFPVPDWVPLIAKLGALLAVIATFLLIGASVGIGWQLGHGYNHLEPGLYLATLALAAIPFVLLAVLALFLQVLSNNKFLGYLLTIVWLVLSAIGFGLLHWEQNLYNYGNAPDVPYSDMNGFGHFLKAALWFDFYWASCAVVLLVLAALFWVRGTDHAWHDRLREAHARLHTPAKVVLALGLLAFIGSGSWIYYNTNVLNRYQSSADQTKQRADYEKKYAKYKNLPQPRITAVKADVDIYPYQRRLDIRGHYTLVNKTAAPISELHVNYTDGFTLKSLAFAPHDTVSADKQLGYTIYRLKTPLAPGASMDFAFTLEYAPKGFTNSPEGQFLAYNGTFFNNTVMPQFGYQTQAQLTDRNDRRKYGLSADRAADAEARRREGAREYLYQQRRGLDQLRYHRVHRRRPDRGGAGLSAEGMDGQRPALFPLHDDRRRDGPTDAAVLLVPVGALRGEARELEGRGYRGVLQPGARVERGPNDPWREGCAGLLRRELHAVPVQATAHPGVSELRQLRAVVRQHHPVLRVDRLHRRSARQEQDRLRLLRHRPRSGAPVVGAPGDRREHAGLDHAQRIAGAVLRADGDEAEVRRRPDAQVPEVRTGRLSGGTRHRETGRGTAGARWRTSSTSTTGKVRWCSTRCRITSAKTR